MQTIYTVVIQHCTDTDGYWASCDLPGGGCTVQGETLQETQKKMLEAIELFIEEPSTNYFLDFEVAYA